MNKKFIRLLITIFSLTLINISGWTNTITAQDDSVEIALLLSGNLGDMSFLDSANQGVEEIQNQHDNVSVQVVEMGEDATQYESNVLDFSDAGYDIIIGSGWMLQEPFQNVAENYPEVTYILFDAEVDNSLGDFSNVYSINYKVNEASYLAGVMAASMSESGILGFLGGADGPGINDFLVGYIEGAQSINEDIKVIVGYVGSFADSPRAKEMALAQYNQGADFIYTAAGASGIGTLEAALELDKYAIGVDADQALLFEESNPDLASHIPTSVMKNVGASLIRAYELYVNDELPLGEADILGLQEDAVGLADNQYYQDLVPDEVKSLLDETEAQIVEGETTVSTAYGMSTDEIQTMIESVRP